MKYMDKGISIAIPTYDSNGEGAEFVKFSLEQIKKQDFKHNFEYIILTRSGLYKILIEEFSHIKDMFIFCADMLITFHKNNYIKMNKTILDVCKLEDEKLKIEDDN